MNVLNNVCYVTTCVMNISQTDSIAQNITQIRIQVKPDIISYCHNISRYLHLMEKCGAHIQNGIIHPKQSL